MTIETPRILFIDSYDSFTFNLAALCRQAIPECIIHIIKNDQLNIDQLRPLLKSFSAVIVGPGPGSPDNSRDIAVIKDLWRISDSDLLPIFGVCLGHQSLAVEHGAEVKRLNVVKHGQVSQIVHNGVDLLEGVTEVRAVRYHSLHVQLAEGGDIEPLAWVDDGPDNGTVLIAARHKHRPFWSVQYHPESALTDDSGLAILRNFWILARQWSRKRDRRVEPLHPSARTVIGPAWPHLTPAIAPSLTTSLRTSVATSIIASELTVTAICERLGVCDETHPFVLLDSAAKPGRFSIIGSLLPNSGQILYSIGDSSVTVKSGTTCTRKSLEGESIWQWLSGFTRSKGLFEGSPDIPFWGGFVGLLSYELGVTSLSVPLRPHRRDHNKHHDVNLMFVERSIVVDHHTGKIYIQSILPGDDLWISQTRETLSSILPEQPLYVPPSKQPSVVRLPDRSQYISRIEQAKAALCAGNSYELCLTANTHVQTSRSLKSWDRYKALRRTNPAPHSAYLRLHPSTFLSSSPERFLSFSRPPASTYQLRPIKGTLRKAPGITRAHAEEALRGSSKEVAENLMIVDLIRHDLHGVVGLDVEVKRFCGIEEYETVWQMTSVIEGKLPAQLESDPHFGMKVLESSLPPGSMTGAPKKRSVEILQTLEDEDRSLYSGVFGYWCVGGGGDWSVAIRSCFRYGDMDDASQSEAEEWIIGAGGAITALSEPEAEWDEMLAKLQSALGAFGVRLES